jgi:dTDP-4-dehydrorhamnose reductase
VSDGTAVVPLDITDRTAVDSFVEGNAIDVIVNCAAYTAVDRAETDEERALLLNATAPGYLAEAIGRRGGQLIQISTDYVFNGKSHRPYVEDDTPSPDSVYGSTKLASELGVSKFCKNAMVVRTAWLYSTFGHNFVKTMIRLGMERKEIGVVADQVGTPTYARDLASALLTIVEKGIKPGVYHYTNEGVASWYDFTKAIHRIYGIQGCNVKPLHTDEYPTPAKRPHYSILDKTKIKKAFGIEIPHWEESLKDCIELLEK